MLDNKIQERQLLWLDYVIRHDDAAVETWCEHRDVECECDPPEIHRVIADRARRDVLNSELWKTLPRVGFTKTWERFRTNEVAHLQLATILYSASLLREVAEKAQW